MAIDRSQYQIDLKTSADTGGVEKTIASAQEAREAFQLLRGSAADALGSIGELIHLLENPYLLAVAGATLATKLLAQELQSARENTGDQIKKSMELRDAFQESRAQHSPEIQSPNDPNGKNEAVLKAQEQTKRAADAARGLQGDTGQAHAPENLTEDETKRLQRLKELRLQTPAGTWAGENAVASAGATSADVRGSITRTQQHISDINPGARDREGGHASPEEVAKLIELNDFLIGFQENQAEQHSHLLDKIDAMMSRVQALEATQRNTRWQSQ
jgi:hypothetical protein